MEWRYERSETLEDVGRVKAARPEKLGERKQGSSRAGLEKERTHASPVQERITEGHTNMHCGLRAKGAGGTPLTSDGVE